MTGLFDGDVHDPQCHLPQPALQHITQTLDLLRRRRVEPEVVEYLKTPPSRAEIARLISRCRDRRHRGPQTRIPLRQLIADASDDELLDAMAANPILIRRPFVVTAGDTDWPGRSTRHARFCEGARRGLSVALVLTACRELDAGLLVGLPR